MKISILGTNGFLSSAIAKFANKEGWTLIMYGLDEPIGHKYDTFYKINLMDSNLDCSSLLDSNIIIYAIGAGIQANLKEGFNLIYNLNVTVPITICNKLKELDYKGCFVTFGSYFEMGETMETRYFTEEDILTSICPAPNDYTVSKRMLSKFVASYKHNFTHWHFYIPTIYGAGENPKRLIPYVINAIRNGEELHFTAGDQTRQYVHVSEVPRMLALAYEKKLPSGLYNIEGKETLTVKEIVSLIHHAMGKEVSEGCFGSVQRVDVAMKYLALDGTLLKKTIGFVAKNRICDMLWSY
ncbi:dTDP-glucose 4,6-dehydratase [Prevotella sp. P5-92]|uniref:NAD-dependent epimerase/dehydratase family protein n=1 Tax=Prevotella sp. P5-92 TaxID=2024222 RepID=UPI000B974D76|nr:NAD(P)-dependent oxidoreductase [Prevotella sp. P5-92]OYP57321.1 dTDP-glucose 4,6-dehydratase [Prevotella sp. P5-92]